MKLSKCCNAEILNKEYYWKCSKCGREEILYKDIATPTPPTSTDEPLLTPDFDSTAYVREYRDSQSIDPPSTEVEEVFKKYKEDWFFKGYFDAEKRNGNTYPENDFIQAITRLIQQAELRGRIKEHLIITPIHDWHSPRHKELQAQLEQLRDES